MFPSRDDTKAILPLEEYGTGDGGTGDGGTGDGGMAVGGMAVGWVVEIGSTLAVRTVSMPLTTAC